MRKTLLALMIIVATTVEAQAPTYQRGDTVRIKGLARPGELKVIGIPGDYLRNDDTGLSVNGIPVTYFASDFLERFKWQGEKVIPEGHYFVMGTERLNKRVTENVGLHPAADLERMH